MEPLINGGVGGTGDPIEDFNRAVSVRAGQIGGQGTFQPTGDYADLPGKYGNLVDPKQGPGDLRLQAGALQSLHGILPLSAVLPGSYRSHEQQANLYASDQQRYAPPGKSLHEYGLAIDVNTGFLSEHPEVRQQLINAGWYQERPDEPWHFSYGFFSPVPTAPTPTPKPTGGRNRPTPVGRSAPTPRPRRRQPEPPNVTRQRI